VGLGLLVVWVGALQLILDLGKEHEWFASPMIATLGVVSVLGFAAFLIWELTEKQPIVSLRVFRRPGFLFSALTMALGYGAFMSANVLTPNWLQANMGYTATQAGMACSTLGVCAILFAPVAARLVSKVDCRWLICGGLFWLGAVCLLRASATTSAATFGQVAGMVFLMGAGMPFFFLPLNTFALSSIDEDETAAGAGMMNFIRTVSGAFATSLVNTAWEDGASRKQDQLSGILNGAQSTIDGFMALGQGHDQAVANLTRIVQGQAVMLATNDLMATSSIIFLFAGLAIWLAPKPARVAEASLGH
jgi:DHA2 family multidrug resistance protein